MGLATPHRLAQHRLLLSVTVLNYLGSTTRHAEASRAVARTGFWLSLFRFQGATRHSPRQGVGAGFPRLVARPGDRHGTRSDLGCQCRRPRDFRARQDHPSGSSHRVDQVISPSRGPTLGSAGPLIRRDDLGRHGGPPAPTTARGDLPPAGSRYGRRRRGRVAGVCRRRRSSALGRHRRDRRHPRQR